MKLDSKCGEKNPHPSSQPPKTMGKVETYPNDNCAKKRRVGNLHEYLGTRLNSDVTSATTPLAIEGVKDGDGKANLACHSTKTKGENEGKEKETAPATHTTASAHSACLAVDACCKCGPTLTCKTTRCECRKAARVCVSFRCLERCVNSAPQTRLDETRSKEGTKGTGKRKRQWGKAKGGTADARDAEDASG